MFPCCARMPSNALTASLAASLLPRTWTALSGHLSLLFILALSAATTSMMFWTSAMLCSAPSSARDMSGAGQSSMWTEGSAPPIAL